jgi:hypothetical protein
VSQDQIASHCRRVKVDFEQTDGTPKERLVVAEVAKAISAVAVLGFIFTIFHE